MKLDLEVNIEIDEMADRIADALSMEEAVELIRRIDLSYAEWEFTNMVGEWYAQELAKYDDEDTEDTKEQEEVAENQEADRRDVGRTVRTDSWGRSVV